MVSDDFSSSDSGSTDSSGSSSDSYSGDSFSAGDSFSGGSDPVPGSSEADGSASFDAAAGPVGTEAPSRHEPVPHPQTEEAEPSAYAGMAKAKQGNAASHSSAEPSPEPLPPAGAGHAGAAELPPFDPAGEASELPPDANILQHGRQRREAAVLSVDERLAALRARCRRSVNTMGVIGLIPALGMGYIVGHFISLLNVLSVAMLEAMLPLGLSESLYGYSFLLMYGLVPLALGGLFAWLIWKGLLSHYARIYWRATLQLNQTGLMSIVVNEEWTRILYSEMQEQMVVKWISPPEPKNIEQQLEFAATFYDQLHKMQYGRARLEGGNLWSGALGWFTGQRNWCFCACLANPCWPFALLGLPFWVLSAVYYIQKIAVTAAYCDFLLRDGPFAGPSLELFKLMPAGMRNALRQPS